VVLAGSLLAAVMLPRCSSASFAAFVSSIVVASLPITCSHSARRRWPKHVHTSVWAPRFVEVAFRCDPDSLRAHACCRCWSCCHCPSDPSIRSSRVRDDVSVDRHKPGLLQSGDDAILFSKLCTEVCLVLSAPECVSVSVDRTCHSRLLDLPRSLLFACSPCSASHSMLLAFATAQVKLSSETVQELLDVALARSLSTPAYAVRSRASRVLVVWRQ
jgi:hypothetical protein